MSRSAIESAASKWIVRRDAGFTAAEEIEFREWLAKPEHARAFARHEQAWRIFSVPSAAGLGPSLAAESRRRAVKRRRRFTAAITGVAAFAIGLYFWQAQVPPESPPASGGVVVFRPFHHVLPDGSVLDYKTGAQVVVEFTAEGTAPRRVRLVKGEAHFQVEKNKARPFIVEVGDIAFRAVGTAFTVERTASKAELVVSEGTVAIDQRMADSVANPPTTLATLTAGQRTFVELTAAAVPHVEPLAPAEVADRLSWRETRLEFTGTSLSEAVRLINQFNTVKFVIDDPSLSALEISGFVRVENPDLFVLLLDKGFNIKAERQGDVIHLRKAL